VLPAAEAASALEGDVLTAKLLHPRLKKKTNKQEKKQKTPNK